MASEVMKSNQTETTEKRSRKKFGKIQLSQIPNYSEDKINKILSFLDNVDDFKKVLNETNKDYAEFKDNHGREKIKGVWTNRFGNEELVVFASTYQDRPWEHDEVVSLLKGDAISVTMKDKDANDIEINGYLDTYTYMGNHQVGFKVAPKEVQVQKLSKAQRERIAYEDFELIDDIHTSAQAEDSDEMSI